MNRLIPLLVLAVLGCESERDSPISPEPDEVAVDLDVFPREKTFCEGDLGRFTVQVAWLSEDPPPLVPPEVTWSSSNPEVLTIGADGVAETVAPGVAEVRGMVSWPGVIAWKTAAVEVLPGKGVRTGGRELRPGVIIGGTWNCVVGG